MWNYITIDMSSTYHDYVKKKFLQIWKKLLLYTRNQSFPKRLIKCRVNAF